MLIDSSYIIKNSTFISNRAISNDGQGGAIYHKKVDLNSSLTISLSSFIKNIATQSGGAVQWYSSKPSIELSSFTSNSAFYGPDLASFTSSLHHQTSSRFLSSQTFPPGEPSPSTLKILLKDHYNQTVLSDNSTILRISSDNSSLMIQGQTSSTASKGFVEFSDIKIFGAPNSESYIVISADGIDADLGSDLQINVLLRNCIAGEQLIDENHCEKCKAPTYSLIPGTQCIKCPYSGECLGSNLIYAKPGFWRRDNKTDLIFECFNKEACLGDQNTPKCDKGYEGNICQVCSQGFSAAQRNSCVECLDRDQNIGRIVILLMLVAAFLVFQIYSTLQAVYKERSVTAIYLKILVNYLQLVSLTIGFELDWPRLVRKLFKVQEQAPSSSEQFISFDCFLSEYFNPFFSKVLLVSLLPLICILFSLIFWVAWKKIKTSVKVKEKFIGTVIIQLFFFYPSQIRLNFLTFFCTELEKQKFYLTSFMNISCWESPHLIFTLTVAIPSILIFCISFPLVLLVYLIRNRKSLQDEDHKLKYGFLYNGFSIDFYYWEFMIILRKLLIIIFFVFFSRFSVPIQALCTFIVILLSFILQLKYQPYANDQLNTLELMSIMVTAVTIYSGIFFLTGDLTEEAKIIIFVLMVLANLIFIGFWTYLTFSFFFAKLYLKLRICKRIFKGRFDRWALKIHPINQIDNLKDQNPITYDAQSPYLKEVAKMDIYVERLDE